MKVSHVALIIASCGALGAAYVGLTARSSVGNGGTTANDAKAERDGKAVASMMQFLETAPPSQLQAMNVDPKAGKDSPGWNAMMAYTKRSPDAVWIAQVMSESSPTGTIDEARTKLGENPPRAVEQITQVLGDLPDRYANERSRLLKFIGGIAARVDDTAAIENLLMKELQRPQEYELTGAVLVPQAVALNEYIRVTKDPARAKVAFKMAMDAQTQPAVRTALQRIEIPGVIEPQVEARVEAPKAPESRTAPTHIETVNTESEAAHPEAQQAEAQPEEKSYEVQPPAEREPASPSDNE